MVDATDSKSVIHLYVRVQVSSKVEAYLFITSFRFYIEKVDKTIYLFRVINLLSLSKRVSFLSTFGILFFGYAFILIRNAIHPKILSEISNYLANTIYGETNFYVIVYGATIFGMFMFKVCAMQVQKIAYSDLFVYVTHTFLVKMTKMKYEYLMSTVIGNITTKLSNIGDYVHNVHRIICTEFLHRYIVIISCTLLVWRISLELMLLFLLRCIVEFIYVRYIFTDRYISISKESAEIYNTCSGVIGDMIDNIEYIKAENAYQNELQEQNVYQQKKKAFYYKQIDMYIFNIICRGIYITLCNLLVIWRVIYLCSIQHLDPSSAYFILCMMVNCEVTFWMMSYAFANACIEVGKANKVIESLENVEIEAVQDHSTKSLPKINYRKNIVIQRLCFRYENDVSDVLNNVNLDIPAGNL